MSLEPIRYKNYVWKNNPRGIKILHNRNVRETTVPYSNGVAVDIGRKLRVVRGVGEFFGEDCMNEFVALRNVQLEGGVGYLILPKLKPFLAIFKSLEIEASPLPDLLEYSFEFVEYVEECSCESCYVKRYHVVQKGENLWDIANRYGKKVDNLLALNPVIKRPNNLVGIEKVKIV